MFLVYILIVLGTFIEGEAVLLLAVYLSWSGTLPLNPVSIGAAAFLGAWLGDWFFFELGRRKGVTPLKRWPRLAKRFEDVSGFLSRYPTFVLFLLRFQIACRMIGNYSLGQGQSPRLKYLCVNALACLAWVSVLVPLCDWFYTTMSAIWGSIG